MSAILLRGNRVGLEPAVDLILKVIVATTFLIAEFVPGEVTQRREYPPTGDDLPLPPRNGAKDGIMYAPQRYDVHITAGSENTYYNWNFRYKIKSRKYKKNSKYNFKTR